ncbi:peptide ABC transporter substrate-binding protein [Pseudalkalibacillus caeni]|uniref:Peptide ABC transporter substrate-binding protein n=1 Tax=Exobacillus caeni TaxID=2574798 RepID=A0A5R9FAI7_9BACL|nr:peptide ABC transporter substrate-binding protein [Pseudalkalibacillus caeni]TLS37564.1 peptide ABC transporter substrate-binding protein [Pseudalkalibacillus caeni]
MRKLTAALLSVLLVFALVGCTTSQSSSENNSGSADSDNKKEEKGGEKILLLNNGNEPTSFDPPIGFDSVSWNALNNLMEGLTRLDKDDQPQAATAEDWKVSDDGKTYTFTIRENAKWSNGDPVTAEDFEYALKRLADPNTASPAAFLANFIEGAKEFNEGTGSADDMKVKAVDEKTLEVTLVAPQNYFLSVISNPAFFPVHKATVEENKDWATEADTFVGNGPFKLTKWEHSSEFEFKKNENYWDAENVKLDGVHWAMIDDTNTEYQMFKTGELHQSDVPADLSEQLFEEGKAQVEDQSGTYFYRFNVNMEPFQNENIRKAFALSVDQQKIVDFVTKNKEKAAHAFVGPGFKDPAGGDFRDVGGELVSPDAAKAKELLEKGMKEEGYDTLPKVTMTYNTSDTHKQIAETMQQMFKETLGVDVELANMEWNVFSDEQKAGKLQFSRSSFLADYADPINFMENFQTGHSMNRTGWSNAEFDKLIQDAKAESNEEKRFEMLHQAEEILFEEMPIFPIHYYNQVYLEADNVEGIVRHPVGYLELKWADLK